MFMFLFSCLLFLKIFHAAAVVVVVVVVVVVLVLVDYDVVNCFIYVNCWSFFFINMRRFLF